MNTFKNSFKTVLFSLAICAVSAQAAEDDEYYSHGETIHQEHCTKCHSDQVYSRPNRFVKSLDALNQQVERCKNGNNVPWFDEDTEAVVHFLNKKYYKF